MLLKLKLNIGSDDAKKYNLEKTKEGEIINLEGAPAEHFIVKGWAEPFSTEANPARGVASTSGGQPTAHPADLPSHDVTTAPTLADDNTGRRSDATDPRKTKDFSRSPSNK